MSGTVRDPRTRVVLDVLVVLAGAAVLGVLAGLLWPQLADTVTVTRTGAGLVRDEVALAEQFDAEAWYSLIALAGGLLLGAVMTAWRRTDALVTLFAVLAGAFLAAWLSAELGLALGPDDPTRVLADAAEGATAPAALTLAGAVYWVWPLAAVLGSFLFLLSPLAEQPIEASVATPGPADAPGAPVDAPVDVSGAGESAPPSRP